MRSHCIVLLGLLVGCSSPSTGTTDDARYLQLDPGDCRGCEGGVLTGCHFARGVTSVAVINRPEGPFGADLSEELQCPHDASTPPRVDFEVVEHIFGPEITADTKLVNYVVDGPALVATRLVGDYHYATVSIAAEFHSNEPLKSPNVGLPAELDALKDQLADLTDRFEELCPGTIVPSDDQMHETVYDTCVDGEPVNYSVTECDEFIDYLVFDCGVAPSEAVMRAEPCVELVPSQRLSGNNISNRPDASSAPLDELLAREFVDCLVGQSCDSAPDVDACDPRISGPCEEWVEIFQGCSEPLSSAQRTAREQCEPVVSGMTDGERETFFACIDGLDCDVLISGYWEEPCVPD